MTAKPVTFEDAIKDLNNVTMWNVQEHFPTLLAGLNDAAKRLEANEKAIADINKLWPSTFGGQK